MTFHRSSLATMAQATYNFLDTEGYDAADIFDRAGLDASQIYEADARFPIASTMRLWHIAIRETKRACLFYDVVKFVEPWMLHAVGHPWVASSTLLAALKRLERYHRMLSTNVTIKLEPLQGSWQLIAEVEDPTEHPATDAVLAFTLQMCRRSFGGDLYPLQAGLIRLEPLDASPIEEFFGCELTYEIPRTRSFLILATLTVNWLVPMP